MTCADAEYMAKAVAEYYNTPIFQPKDGEWKLGLIVGQLVVTDVVGQSVF